MTDMAMTRWKEMRCTTPSGRTTFVCLNCGEVTDKPSQRCARDMKQDRVSDNVTRRHAGQFTTTSGVPCHLWPMNDEQYKAIKDNGKFMFIGHVVAPDGNTSSVSIELDIEEAKEFVVRQTELDFEVTTDDQEKTLASIFSKEPVQSAPDATDYLKAQAQRQQAMQGMPLPQGPGPLGGALGQDAFDLHYATKNKFKGP